jgi:hypothetical protein
MKSLLLFLIPSLCLGQYRPAGSVKPAGPPPGPAFSTAINCTNSGAGDAVCSITLAPGPYVVYLVQGFGFCLRWHLHGV